jgi:DNA-binding XRE family transcriptional regulator
MFRSSSSAAYWGLSAQANVTISAWSISIQPRHIPGVRLSIRKRFGLRIAELRKAAGLSQEAFADKCGFARSYMGRIERGGANPSLDAIETLADALRVPVRELFED